MNYLCHTPFKTGGLNRGFPLPKYLAGNLRLAIYVLIYSWLFKQETVMFNFRFYASIMETQKLKEIEDLVNEHQREIINFHYRFVGNLADAEDLAQETFIKAYKKINTLKDYKKAKSWLYSIARNTAIDFFRKNKNKEINLDNSVLENIAQATAVDYQNRAAEKEISKELDHFIEKLVKEDRAIIKLLYYEGFSYKEIITLLNINENTLKSRLHRARKTLLEMIRTSKVFQGSF